MKRQLGWVCWVLILLAWPLADIPASSPHGSMEIDCADCHNAEAWTPVRKPPKFKHAEVGFSLVGSHKGLACRSCHESLEFARVATACADCHRDTHRGEFGFACERCHMPHGWDNRRQMRDRHGQTLFPLTGVHATLDCLACHEALEPQQYASTPTECFDCHAEDYRRTTGPDHEQAGFSTDCQLCHDTRSWDARGFPEHDPLFPINSGAHRGAWNSCSDCHTQGNFQTFECTGCHEHSESRMFDKHDDVPGYAYDSAACYSCHPRGRED